MARKKREEKDPAEIYNPYYGKTEDESHMPEKPFFMWLCIIPGVLLGIFFGLRMENLLLGVAGFGVLGMAAGSMLDKWREGRRKDK